MKGYKVSNADRSKIVGIASKSLAELRKKAAAKLNIPESAAIVLEDGTVVDDEDYFQSLPSQTFFIFYRKNESVMTGVDFLLQTLRSVNQTYLNVGVQASEFLSEKTNELISLLEKNKIDEEPKERSKREEDPNWFEGLETNAQTKEEYMFRKSQDRIRGYLYKFQEDIKKNNLYLFNSSARKELDNCISFFKKQLNLDRYFGCFFDRRCAVTTSDQVDSSKKKRRKSIVINEENDSVKKLKNKSEIIDGKPIDENFEIEMPSYKLSSYCDDKGKFICQGNWKSDNCEFSHHHIINPYMNRESRILFSTWNLDHRIEKSRTIFPTLIKAVEKRRKDQSINCLYFYMLLFSQINLKLVHIVCHDKSLHDITCDPRFLFV